MGEEHADEFFKKEDLHKKEKIPAGIAEATQDEENSKSSEEWFINDKPPGDNVREIFVRPGSIEDDDFITSAS